MKSVTVKCRQTITKEETPAFSNGCRFQTILNKILQSNILHRFLILYSITIAKVCLQFYELFHFKSIVVACRAKSPNYEDCVTILDLVVCICLYTFFKKRRFCVFVTQEYQGFFTFWSMRPRSVDCVGLFSGVNVCNVLVWKARNSFEKVEGT